MHSWGDEWFQKNGKDFYKAINEIERIQHKARIGVYGKEKWGTYRNEYLSFWNGGLYKLLFPSRQFIGTQVFYGFPFRQISHLFYKRYGYGKHEYENETIEKIHEFFKKRANRDNLIHKFLDWLCYFVYFYIDEKFLIPLNNKIGLTKFIVEKIQIPAFNKSFQVTCSKYPNIIDELVICVEGHEFIKPCKWGNVDADMIRKKYWK